MKLVTATALAAGMIGSTSATTSSLLSEDQYQYLFTRYVDKYTKTYETNSIFSKFNTFKDNLNYIIEHNSKNSSFKMAVNHFADLTTAEFASMLNSGLALETSLLHGSETLNATDDSEPLAGKRDPDVEETDWTTVVKNNVKNQGYCGSCWAFSVVGAIEYRHALHNKLPEALNLSEQQLVDCDPINLGCNGGLPGLGFSYLQSAGGVCSTADYPYTGKKESCKHNSCSNKIKPSTFAAIRGKEADLAMELQNGPTTLALAADGRPFQFYASGIMDDVFGCGIVTNHAVVAVGYGVDKETGTRFFKVRNSWGTKWGEEGYMRFAYGKGMCGIFITLAHSVNVYPNFA